MCNFLLLNKLQRELTAGIKNTYKLGWSNLSQNHDRIFSQKHKTISYLSMTCGRFNPKNIICVDSLLSNVVTLPEKVNLFIGLF